MAKLVYDETGRLLFTKEMKEEYTLLMPQMLPVHFGMMKKLLECEGYKVDMLTTNHRGIVDEGLKYVHNDTCYPALLVIGQLIDAVKHGGYDPHKVGLLITQTGGGCRASNYIHLLRKALEKADMAYIPVVSVNLSGLEKNPGFKLTLPFIRKAVYAMMYGDIIVNVANQVRPYEVEAGAAGRHDRALVPEAGGRLPGGQGDEPEADAGHLRPDLRRLRRHPRPGRAQDPGGRGRRDLREVRPPGQQQLGEVPPVRGGGAGGPRPHRLHHLQDLQPGGRRGPVRGQVDQEAACQLFMGYIEGCQKDMIAALQKSGRFRAPGTFRELHSLVHGYLGDGNKMGEGWLLTAEMLELIHSGTNNIVCTQPFGCLPNHIVGKGMIRKLKDDYPDSNIVAIDYDARCHQDQPGKPDQAHAGQRPGPDPPGAGRARGPAGGPGARGRAGPRRQPLSRSSDPSAAGRRGFFLA